ncbi:MAG: acetoacetate decarboxylase family protein [Acidimicrobiales bacterium]
MADPPWLLHGEGMLAWVAGRPARPLVLPPGLFPLPGPAAVVAMRYDDTPVGPYIELSVAVPARLGLRPGLCTVAMVVTSSDALAECRRSWGLPAELGDLRWSAGAGAAGDRTVAWEARGLVFTGHAYGPSVLAPVVPVRSVAWRPTGAVVLARRMRARVRPARCVIEVRADDDLSWLAGHHPGMDLAGARIVAQAARRPAGLLSSVPWRERQAGTAPEPAA